MNMSLLSGTFVRPSETVIEAYWTGTAFKTILVTPNVQVFLQPAFPPWKRSLQPSLSALRSCFEVSERIVGGLPIGAGSLRWRIALSGQRQPAPHPAMVII